MDYAPFKIPSQMAGDFSYRFVIPPFRKKSRLLRLCPCKRGHDASAALPTFCGMREGSNSLLKNTEDSFCLTLTNLRSAARNGLPTAFCRAARPCATLFISPFHVRMGYVSYRSVIPSAQKVPFAAGYLFVNAGVTLPLRSQLFGEPPRPLGKPAFSGKTIRGADSRRRF